MITETVLRAIESRDPDGGTRQPTIADYRAFREWAVATYGAAAFTRYSEGGWYKPDWA